MSTSSSGRGPCVLVEHPSFETSRDAIESDVRRADDLLLAVTWQVARNPAGCPDMLGTPFKRATAWTPEGDIYVLFFTYDAEHGKVHLWHVQQFSAGDDEVEV